MTIPINREVCISTPTALFCTCMNVIEQRLFLSSERTLLSEHHHRNLCGKDVAYTVVRNPVIKNTLCIKCLAFKLPIHSTSSCDVFHYYLFYGETFNTNYTQTHTHYAHIQYTHTMHTHTHNTHTLHTYTHNTQYTHTHYTHTCIRSCVRLPNELFLFSKTPTWLRVPPRVLLNGHHHFVFGGGGHYSPQFFGGFLYP